jgi:hypothetical protein
MTVIYILLGVAVVAVLGFLMHRATWWGTSRREARQIRSDHDAGAIPSPGDRSVPEGRVGSATQSS